MESFFCCVCIMLKGFRSILRSLFHLRALLLGFTSCCRRRAKIEPIFAFPVIFILSCTQCPTTPFLVVQNVLGKNFFAGKRGLRKICTGDTKVLRCSKVLTCGVFEDYLPDSVQVCVSFTNQPNCLTRILKQGKLLLKLIS